MNRKVFMLNLKYPHYVLVATLFFAVTTASCAALEKSAVSFGDLFKGNTKKDITDYGLEDKLEYRKYRYMEKVKQQDEEEEIITRLEIDDERKGTKKKSRRRMKYQRRKKQKQNIFQKILKK